MPALADPALKHGYSFSKTVEKACKLLLLLTIVALAQGPDVGARIPSFRLPDQTGTAQTLESLKGPNGLMLVFYRSADWCPFCKSQLVELETAREDLKKRGLGVAAISYDSVAVLKFFADRKAVHFPLLSDEDSRVIRAFGLLNEEVPKTSEFYGIPHPVTYVIDAQGAVRTRTFEEDFPRRHTVGNLLDRKVNGLDVATKRIELHQYESDSVVGGGQRIKLWLDLELPQKSHVYAPGAAGYIPLDWKLKENASFRALPMTYPSSRNLYLKAIEETLPVYEGKVTLQREIVISEKYAGSELKIEGDLRYQVCDDKQCYVPETTGLRWNLRYEPYDSTRAPAELRRKPR
jgi:peroxiredoxin